jgi:beta-lactam-binding protein with PASTA domain
MGAEPAGAGLIAVPNLVGMTVRDARSAGHHSGVVVTSADLDGPPLGALTWPGIWIVTAQRPAAGAYVERWSPVAVEFAERPVAAGDKPATPPI